MTVLKFILTCGRAFLVFLDRAFKNFDVTDTCVLKPYLTILNLGLKMVSNVLNFTNKFMIIVNFSVSIKLRSALTGIYR